jgi:hypothetical protein
MDVSLMWLVWLTLGTAVTTAVVLVIVKNARPTRSVAHVLYEVEHSAPPRV